jgi:hypothetical protein
LKELIITLRMGTMFLKLGFISNAAIAAKAIAGIVRID